MITINDVWAAYEEAEGSWSGCDWPTRFGSLGLDLNGVSSAQARVAVSRWRDLAAGGAASAGEKGDLADMGLHLKLRGAVVRLGEGSWSGQAASFPPSERSCAEALATEWEVATYFLAEIEADARWAEQEAWGAVRAAEKGDWSHALWHARRAASIEAGYFAPRLWRRLRGVIEQAAG